MTPREKTIELFLQDCDEQYWRQVFAHERDMYVWNDQSQRRLRSAEERETLKQTRLRRAQENAENRKRFPVKNAAYWNNFWGGSHAS